LFGVFFRQQLKKKQAAEYVFCVCSVKSIHNF